MRLASQAGMLGDYQCGRFVAEFLGVTSEQSSDVVTIRPAQWSDLWRSEDYWAIWIGGLLLAVGLFGTYANRPAEFDAAVEQGTDLPAVSSPFKPWLAQPGASKKTWESDPRAALFGEGYNHLPGILGAMLVTWVLFTLAVAVMNQQGRRFALAFVPVFLLGGVAYGMSAQKVVNAYGLEYVLWALVLGLLISNTVGTPAWLRPAVRTELFIKTGLVLLGADILLHQLLRLGYPGIFISWVTTPIVLVATYIFGQRVLKIESKSLNMTISADMSVCGVSAAIATAAACRAKKEELTVAIGLSLAFTAVMMIAMPAFIQAVGMDQIIAGAWLGGTIDATGAVAAAAALLTEPARDVAVIVKMIQNVLIGVIAFGVAVYWTTRVERDHSGARPSLWEIWRRFPKFVLGFLAASLVGTLLSGMVAGGEPIVKATIDGVTKTLMGWCFCLAFVSIGLETDFRRLARFFRGGKPLVLYVVGQTLNLLLTLFMAWVMFNVVFPEARSALLQR